MFVFTEESTKISLTPWGKEVKRRLLELEITQQTVVDMLSEKGFNIDKMTFSRLLKGIAVNSRKAEIHEINVFLGIKESNG